MRDDVAIGYAVMCCVVCAVGAGTPELGKVLLELTEQMQPCHRSTLRYLMAHFIRLWRIQHDSGLEDGLDKLSHVFCHILLRPPWEKIM